MPSFTFDQLNSSLRNLADIPNFKTVVQLKIKLTFIMLNACLHSPTTPPLFYFLNNNSKQNRGQLAVIIVSGFSLTGTFLGNQPCSVKPSTHRPIDGQTVHAFILPVLCCTVLQGASQECNQIAQHPYFCCDCTPAYELTAVYLLASFSVI